LKKRMDEFFTLSAPDRLEIINNALEAGPTIPFPNFSKLFSTWLEILATISEEKRTVMFSTYISQILKNPQKLILFNLDGILEVFVSLDSEKKQTIANSIRQIISGLSDEEKKTLNLIIPQSAKAHLGI
ncbi:MAG TPA: hypothetical protein VD828_04430, partial [Candidatus Nitrosotenuis sp.]|nr:hypothetical protein [Candidatus Nitrosotenuis sp.]